MVCKLDINLNLKHIISINYPKSGPLIVGGILFRIQLREFNFMLGVAVPECCIC